MDALSPYALWICVLFIIGYLLITIEHIVKINKPTTAVMMGVLCWAILFANQICTEPYSSTTSCLTTHFSTISQIIIFLLGALVIIEIINIHKGFQIVTNYIDVKSKKKLLWLISFIAFFLSSILDNLTTTLVMVALLQKMVPDREDRLIMGGGIVIAANAGGAWTPIGDVTTTMLWIGGQLTSAKIMQTLFIPSIICLITSIAILSLYLKGSYRKISKENHIESTPLSKTIFYLGIAVLINVPILKATIGLPPFMGILFGVSVLWIVTDLIHSYYEREHLKVPAALARVDLTSTFFFLGILLAVDALDAAGILHHLAEWLDGTFGNPSIIAVIIGLISAIVDNVPLVAASMGMYSLEQYPQDSSFWQLIAFCAGTGGSILVIGSAAGVVYMGMEKVNFVWYLKKISLAALVGYFAGVGSYLLTYWHM